MPIKIKVKRFCRLFINQQAPSVRHSLCQKSRASESKPSICFSKPSNRRIADACCLLHSYLPFAIEPLSSAHLGSYLKLLLRQIIFPLLISLVLLLFFCLLFFVPTEAQANTLPNYLQGGGDAFRTLGNFINGALSFITALLWGIWAIFTALFAKDLMVGADADNIKNQAIKLGAAALVLLSITALPALFAGFAS